MCRFCFRPAGDEKYAGFIGLVGKEPDVTRGLLVDTGASINLHGTDWFRGFLSKVLKPWGLWSTEHELNSSVRITGVGGKSQGMNLAQTVP